MHVMDVSVEDAGTTTVWPGYTVKFPAKDAVEKNVDEIRSALPMLINRLINIKRSFHSKLYLIMSNARSWAPCKQVEAPACVVFSSLI